MSQFIKARLLPGLLAGVAPARQRARAVLLVLAVSCLILALARPQWGFVWEEVKQRGLDLVVAIDTSKSMLAEDISPNRLSRAKLAALDLVQLARSDRLGLVAFAGEAFLQCPLTIDDAVFRQSVEALDINAVSQGGTDLSAAIEAALAAFKEQDNHRVLILLTDGENHDSEALQTAKQAAASGLQIFTIGIGSAEGELIRIKTPDGGTDFVRDENGNVLKSRLNEPMLQEIAGATEKGFYLPLRGAMTIETLYEKGLAPLPKSEAAEKLVKRYHERFYWPLGLGILLLIIEFLFPERQRQKTISEKVTPNSKKPVAVAAALALVLFVAPASASTSSALRDYRTGAFEKSLQEFERLLEKNPDDPRLHFNAGAAAYRNGAFDIAKSRFAEATKAQDLALQQQAYFNQGNTLFQIGENTEDAAKKRAAWTEALKHYDSSLKLAPEDSDAQFNQQYVKERLKELPQPPPQQQQNQQDQNQDQQQDQQPTPGQDNQQNQNQDQQQPSEQPEQEQAGQNQSAQPEKQDSARNQESQPSEPPDPASESKPTSKPDETSATPQTGDAGQEDPKTKSEDQTPSESQMTPQEARQILDTEKGQERMLNFKPKTKTQNPLRKIKDW